MGHNYTQPISYNLLVEGDCFLSNNKLPDSLCSPEDAWKTKRNVGKFSNNSFCYNN